jgi:hypothetical protein
MALGGATTPALDAVRSEIQARSSSTARPVYIESKGANGTVPHVPVGTAAEVTGPEWGHSVPGTDRNATLSQAPPVSAPTGLPRVAAPFAGITGDMAPGSNPDGYHPVKDNDHWDGQVLTGTAYDVHAQSTDSTGRKILYSGGNEATRRVELFPDKRRGFGPSATSPYASPVQVPIDQVAPDARPSNPPGSGSLAYSTVGALWRGSGSAYSPVPQPDGAVNVDSQSQDGPMRSWG